MKKKNYRNITMVVIITLSCVCTTGNILGENHQKNIISTSNETEYWALIVGVSKIEGLPEADNLLAINGQSANELKELLLKSHNWNEDHIKLLTGEKATTFEIMKGLRWLAKNDDGNDICFFYISSLGLQTPDLFPRDENDDYDECLVTYNTFNFKIPLPWIHLLFDDQINFFLNMLDAQGICVIIESEYSGGYNDGHDNIINNKLLNYKKDELRYINNMHFNENIARDLQKQGRIIITTCEEYTYVNVNWILIHDIMAGLQGFADVNNDDLVSIEEAYYYATSIFIEKCEKEFLVSVRPQLFDNYDGELIFTESQLPPDKPTLNGPETGDLNDETIFTISSTDPENDRIRYYVDWGDGTEEWTDFYESEEEVNISHSWNEKGTFTIYFECEDEQGNGIYEFPMMDRTVITIIEDEIIDQKMTDRYEGQTCNWAFITDTQALAQSFIPQQSIITKVDLQIGFVSAGSEKSNPIYISIRENLTSQDIISISITPKEVGHLYMPICLKTPWLTVDFPDTELIPGNKYYIIARYHQSGSLATWDHGGKFYFNDPDYNGDPYQDGDAFISYNREHTWDFHSPAHDFCFVTYGN